MLPHDSVRTYWIKSNKSNLVRLSEEAESFQLLWQHQSSFPQQPWISQTSSELFSESKFCVLPSKHEQTRQCDPSHPARMLLLRSSSFDMTQPLVQLQLMMNVFRVGFSVCPCFTKSLIRESTLATSYHNFRKYPREPPNQSGVFIFI